MLDAHPVSKLLAGASSFCMDNDILDEEFQQARICSTSCISNKGCMAYISWEDFVSGSQDYSHFLGSDLTLPHRKNSLLCYRNSRKRERTFPSILQTLLFHMWGFYLLKCMQSFWGSWEGTEHPCCAYAHLNRKEGDLNNFSLRANEMASTADMVEAGKLMQEKQHNTFVPQQEPPNYKRHLSATGHKVRNSEANTECLCKDPKVNQLRTLGTSRLYCGTKCTCSASYVCALSLTVRHHDGQMVASFSMLV